VRKLLLIGIGTGNPEHVTLQGVRALNAAEVIFLIGKGDAKAELMRVRREICERFIDGAQPQFVEAGDPERDRTPTDYGVAVEDWHAARAELYEDLIATNLGEDECGAFLVWGDPSLYDSTIRIIDRIRASGRLPFAVEVIPGITSVQALAAGHRIALNGIGEPVTITTGRRLAEDLSQDGATVVMLDARVDFAGLDPDLTIHWGAYLGTADELLVSGRLGDVAELIRETRREARARHGWIMDIYRLSRPAT
jgi:precorrin-6A synthase